jgi:hypothetical protein
MKSQAKKKQTKTNPAKPSDSFDNFLLAQEGATQVFRVDKRFVLTNIDTQQIMVLNDRTGVTSFLSKHPEIKQFICEYKIIPLYEVGA